VFGLTILDSEIFQLWQQKNSEVLKKLSSFLSREESRMSNQIEIITKHNLKNTWIKSIQKQVFYIVMKLRLRGIK
jgi:hypothetical protein